MRDYVIGYPAGVALMLLFTRWYNSQFPDPPVFIEGIGFGIGIGFVLNGPDVIGAFRRRPRRDETAEMSAPALTSVQIRRLDVPVARFGADVEEHFADPVVRGRYVIAAYRRGLLSDAELPPAVAGLGDLGPAWVELATPAVTSAGGTVERAAADIGYDRSADEADADVTTQLIHYALRTGDARRYREALIALAPSVELATVVKDEPEWMRSHRRDGLRESIIDDLDARFGPQLTDTVHAHFADPTTRAHDLIVSYRLQAMPSADVPQRAAEVIADLPGAGEAWTELAMASSTSPRSELEPILDRAAEEIGYHRDPLAAECDLYEAAAYRAVVDCRVREESQRLWALTWNDDVYLEGGHDPALEGLRDAHAAAGDDYHDQIRDTRHHLIDYLNAHY
ncbi:hypothetical protein [Tsukamurella strandjordii]|uniref:Uncharacterized protein n=1 Tax=Tsukamurella strandjordii TaxID=147577 RepID=A0AA90NEY5_9ACTN|nr:hypothetical protein [Tsukamurella strandjordii]MDP0397196.1 hypothetical protein [Tsukamurella strandjordii]